MKRLLKILAIYTLMSSCAQEKISLSPTVDETFYVEHLDSKMRVQVRGNTLSDKIVLTVHGGPGGSSYYLSNLKEMQTLVEPAYAVAYWDQPLAGASQGNKVGFKIEQIADGLGKVIATLKSRYGNKKIILFSESWGGIITTSFLAKGENQAQIAGWINSDGPHDFNLMDREIIKMAVTVGEEEIRKGNHVETWKNIVHYCKNNNPAGNYEVSKKLNDLLGDAEYLIDSVVKVDFNTATIFKEEMIKNNAPLTALGVNLLSNEFNEVEKDAYSKDYIAEVKKINVPILLLWGKYDFIAPPAVADSLFESVHSVTKRKVILKKSGHNAFLQEPEIYWKEFTNFINSL